MVCEVFVEGGPGDVAGDASEELVQEGIAVLAIIGERNESMSKIEFRTIDCLATLKIGRTDAGGDNPYGAHPLCSGFHAEHGRKIRSHAGDAPTVVQCLVIYTEGIR